MTYWGFSSAGFQTWSGFSKYLRKKGLMMSDGENKKRSCLVGTKNEKIQQKQYVFDWMRKIPTSTFESANLRKTNSKYWRRKVSPTLALNNSPIIQAAFEKVAATLGHKNYGNPTFGTVTGNRNLFSTHFYLPLHLFEDGIYCVRVYKQWEFSLRFVLSLLKVVSVSR